LNRSIPDERLGALRRDLPRHTAVMARYLPDIAAGSSSPCGWRCWSWSPGCRSASSWLRSLRFRPLNVLIVLHVDLFRALPPLVVIVLLYFAMPNAGWSPFGFVATWLALTLVLSAFAEEIFWAGILSVPKGQWEAARSTGLGFLGTLAWVVLPQAVRVTIPPLTNRTIAITKGTALGSVVAVSEILASDGRLLLLQPLAPDAGGARLSCCSSRWCCSAAGSRPASPGSGRGAMPGFTRPSSTSRSSAPPGASSSRGSATLCCCRWSWCRSDSRAGWRSPCWLACAIPGCAGR
jgi:polar amino acid transport system permease protein